MNLFKKTLILAAFLAANTLLADVQFIANPGVGDSALSKADLEKMLVGKMKKWGDGSTLKLVVIKGSDLHKEMAKAYAGKSDSQFDNHWKRLLFTGQGIAPVEVSDEAEMVRTVSSTPGALGYISTGAGNGDVKLIQVQG